MFECWPEAWKGIETPGLICARFEEEANFLSYVLTMDGIWIHFHDTAGLRKFISKNLLERCLFHFLGSAKYLIMMEWRQSRPKKFHV